MHPSILTGAPVLVEKVIFIGKDIIEENMRLAQKLRTIYDRYNVKVFEFLGGPGSGKTSILERLITLYTRIVPAEKIAYIGGDVATTLDAERIAKTGVRVVQVNTGGTCHLEVPHVEKAIETLGGFDSLRNLEIIFIENVGNIICPFNFPLGAHARIMIADVTEGEDKFVKHPLSTRVSDIIVINKIDLAEYMGVDVNRMIMDVRRINPRAKIILASARLNKGINNLLEILEEYRRA
jgi:hydrogenase nickel incorporation protein HypB